MASKRVWSQPSGLPCLVITAWKLYFNPSWRTLISSRKCSSWYGTCCHRTWSTKPHWDSQKEFKYTNIYTWANIFWNELLVRFRICKNIQCFLIMNFEVVVDYFVHKWKYDMKYLISGNVAENWKNFFLKFMIVVGSVTISVQLWVFLFTSTV